MQFSNHSDQMLIFLLKSTLCTFRKYMNVYHKLQQIMKYIK